MRAWIENAWQQGHPLLWLLAPLTALFWGITALRRMLYRLGIKQSVTMSVPVIVVGNISVGGNGKTPMVLWLVEWLRSQGYRPGVISRGYGGNSEHYPLLVTSDSHSHQVGDEPALIVQRTGCPMAVGPDRIAAATLLLESAEVDVIISDDGLQHYRLARDIELVIIDGQRRLGNGLLMPMGPLREGPSRLASVDLVITNGGEPQQGEYPMSLTPSEWLRVKDNQPVSSTEIAEREAVAMAGIGHPPRFFDTLKALGLRPIACHGFADHQAYTVEELQGLCEPAQMLLMTEKDAVKCRSFAGEHWYYLPVTASLPDEVAQYLKTKLHSITNKQ